MIFSKWKFIILIIVKYQSYESLTYLPVNITRIDTMLRRMDNILSACQTDEMNYVGLLKDSETPENSPSTFLKNIPMIRLTVPILDLNESFYSRSIYYNRLFQYGKLNAFVLFISSVSNLKRVMEKLRDSIWWNPWAFYTIVDMTVNICVQPEAYLSIAWNMDLESSIFFCADTDKGYTAYTYNRYGNPTPKAWRTVQSSISEENQTWCMLKYEIRDDTTCEDLYFNKKIQVGGYRIKLVAVPTPPTLAFDPLKKGTEKYGGMDGFIMKALFNKMNATMSVTMLDKNSRTHPLLQNVSASEYDMLMNAQYIFNKPNSTMTYPHVDSGISTLTRPRGFDSNETKILKFMNPQLIIGIIIISIVTVLVLGIFAGLELGLACLEVTRITINASVLRFPRETPLRIYLITVILLFLITGSTFQSSLSSILTSSTSRPDIDSNSALKQAGYPIYAFGGYKNAIQDLVLRSRVRKTDSWDCSRYVVEHADTACVADRSRLMRIAFENNLHISKHRVTNLYMGYVTRPNFPLVKRMGRLLMAMNEGGLINYWREKTVAIYKNRWSMKQEEMKRNKYRTMNINDLLFVFYILLLGLGISFVTFLSELSVIHWKRFWMCRSKGKRGRTLLRE